MRVFVALAVSFVLEADLETLKLVLILGTLFVAADFAVDFFFALLAVEAFAVFAVAFFDSSLEVFRVEASLATKEAFLSMSLPKLGLPDLGLAAGVRTP